MSHWEISRRSRFDGTISAPMSHAMSRFARRGSSPPIPHGDSSEWTKGTTPHATSPLKPDESLFCGLVVFVPMKGERGGGESKQRASMRSSIGNRTQRPQGHKPRKIAESLAIRLTTRTSCRVVAKRKSQHLAVGTDSLLCWPSRLHDNCKIVIFRLHSPRPFFVVTPSC